MSGVEPRVLDRLLFWMRQKVPGAQIVGVLYVQEAPKTLAQRVGRLGKTVWKNPRYLGFVARRVLAFAGGVLAGLSRGCVYVLHAYRPPRRPQFHVDDLRQSCRQSGCALCVTSAVHAPESLEFVRGLNADLGVVFGTPILKPKLFTIPRLGSINLHQRKVPDYRGGGPVGLWEMLDGQTEIGVTVHRVLQEVDAGAVLRADTIPIEPYDTLESLALKAHVVGIELLVQTVADHVRGEVREHPQIGPSRVFRGPGPLELRAYKRRLASMRPGYHAPRGRPAWKLLVRLLVFAPLVLLRNWSRRWRGTFPVVVLFHHVVTDRPHFLGMPTAHFFKHLEWLHRYYRVVDLETALSELRSGRVTEPTVVLTFDDGYRDNHLNLLAATLVADIPATLFVCSQRIDTQQPFDHDLEWGFPGFLPLTWDQLRELKMVGFRVGSHTRTHFDCGSTDPVRLHDEIVASQAEIEEHLGPPVEMFSFPIGLPANISRVAMERARSTYRVVCSAYGGFMRPGPSDQLWHVFRCSHPPDLGEFELLLQSALELGQPTLWMGGDDLPVPVAESARTILKE